MKFECTKCGKCCILPSKYGDVSGPYVTEQELLAIKERIDKDLNIVKINQKTFQILFEGKCGFLRDDGTCEIYDIIPLSCSLPPIAYDSFVPCYGDVCEGIGIGKEYSEQEIELIRKQFINAYGEGPMI